MTKHYRIKLTNEDGIWWWQTDRRCWCDCHEDASTFSDFYEARALADTLKPGFNRVEVVGFK
jgi:hypothetical protein